MQNQASLDWIFSADKQEKAHVFKFCCYQQGMCGHAGGSLPSALGDL